MSPGLASNGPATPPAGSPGLRVGSPVPGQLPQPHAAGTSHLAPAQQAPRAAATPAKVMQVKPVSLTCVLVLPSAPSCYRGSAITEGICCAHLVRNCMPIGVHNWRAGAAERAGCRAVFRHPAAGGARAAAAQPAAGPAAGAAGDAANEPAAAGDAGTDPGAFAGSSLQLADTVATD